MNSAAIKNRKKQNGFTLIELMIVLVVAGVLLAIGIPSFQQMIKSNRLTVTTNELIGAINFARSEAAKRGRAVHFEPGSAASGSIVRIGSDTIRSWAALPSGVTIDSTHSVYSFSGSGIVDNQDTFTICDDRTGETGSKIELLASGSLSRKSETCT